MKYVLGVMQRILKQLEGLDSGTHLRTTRRAAEGPGPTARTGKRILLSLCVLGLGLTMLVSIVTLNEWLGLAIQGLALSGPLLPLVNGRKSAKWQGAGVELSEGSERCLAAKTTKR